MTTSRSPKPVAAILLAALIASPAAAQQVRAVSYADLDLASPAGKATLSSRVHAAVRAVCSEAETTDLALRRQHKACLETARIGAQREVAAILARRAGERLALGR